MESFDYRINKIQKASSFNKNFEKQVNKSAKLFNSTKSIDDQDKGFVFSLSLFDKKNKTSKNIPPKQQVTPEHSFEQELPHEESDKQSKRRKIYGSQSFKQKFDQKLKESVQSNTNLFSMVFLNKKGASKSEQKSTVSTDLTTNTSQGKIQPFNPQKLASEVKVDEKQGLKISDFQLGKKLGAGKFGQVFIAKHIATGFICGIKKISKKNIDSKLVVQLVRQIKIQSFLNHPNIVKMYTFFSDKDNVYLMLQLCYSGQLYEFLRKKRRISEIMTKNIINQLCRALDFMHQSEIIHRDIKPENVIYHAGLLKICDFGWSISTNTMRQTFCGTPLYVSPELLERKAYNNKIDVWSIGVLTYELLFGRVPFEITTEQDFVKIIQDEIKFSKVTKVSDEAKDFILICLQKDPRDRYTLPQLMEHPFVSKIEAVSMAQLY